MSELKTFFIVSNKPGCKFEVVVEAESAPEAAIQFCKDHDLQVDLLVFEAYAKLPLISWRFSSEEVGHGEPTWAEYVGGESLANLQLAIDNAVRKFIPTRLVKGGLVCCHRFMTGPKEVQP